MMQRLGELQGVGYICKDIETTMQAWLGRVGVGPFTWYQNLTTKMKYLGQEQRVLMDVAVAYQNGMQVQLVAQRSQQESLYTHVLKEAGMDCVMHHLLYAQNELHSTASLKAQEELQVMAFGETKLGRFMLLRDEQVPGLCANVMELPPAMHKFRNNRIQLANNWKGEEPIRILDMADSIR